MCIASGAAASDNSVCIDGAIRACGSGGAVCCANNRCDANACCSGGVCAASATACLGGGSCSLGSCGGCGGAGKPCCHGDANGGATADYCTEANTACDPASNICKACGAPGLICCDGSFCDDGGCCDHSTVTAAGGCVSAGSSVADGTLCTASHGGDGACGGAGQPICGSSVGCTAVLTRETGVGCVACGVRGQPCCVGVRRGYCAAPFACNLNTGLCADCGGNGQPCCVGAQCPDSTTHDCSNGFCR